MTALDSSGPTLDFEGHALPLKPGDTVAAAMYRAGVKTFSRSFKYHRRRGLHCLTGDCPNCLINLDGEPFVRACVTEAAPGQVVRREGGWPSTDHDIFALADRLHWLMPVGFYYKTFLRPRWLWQRVEPWMRSLAGRGAVSATDSTERRELRHLHPDVLVVGGGVAGLSAALAAAAENKSVLLCDEGRIGEKIAPGPYRDRVEELRAEVANTELITILERTPAVGIYEGPLVVLNEPSLLHHVHPGLIVVATGAVEIRGVFPGSDRPGVWLARGAARLAGAHRVLPAKRIVMIGCTNETDAHAETLRKAGGDVTVVDGKIIRARGQRCIRSVVVEVDGRRREVHCDALVLSLGLVPRNSLALQGAGLPVVAIGDAVSPGMTVRQAEEDGRRALQSAPVTEEFGCFLSSPAEGFVCLCEDVEVKDLVRAWREGFRSTELLKRYTTATMGPCQGAMCHGHLRAFVAARSGATGPTSSAVTARPPARGITLAQASAGLREEFHQETALHGRHRQLGATMEPAGDWQRPRHYGDVVAEYWAVRRGVSVMDVGTLGKFLIAGRDATPFLELLYPCRIADLQSGRLRYSLLLGEHGFVVDDGIVCALGDGRWYLTFTSVGAATVEATLKDWAETWSHDIHVVDLTAGMGAINVAGPHSRGLLQRLSKDPLENDHFPYLHHRDITVAGVQCRAIRLGFVGELSYELHHRSDQSAELWDALIEAGRDFEIRPHGLDALRLLRLEKGHIIIGQDTDFDATPSKLNMAWAVKLDKPWFVGKRGIERSASVELRRELLAMSFPGKAPLEGSPLRRDGTVVGFLTSSGWSHVLGCGVSLGWATRTNGTTPTVLESDGVLGTVVNQPFYDPKGNRLRV